MKKYIKQIKNVPIIMFFIFFTTLNIGVGAAFIYYQSIDGIIASSCIMLIIIILFIFCIIKGVISRVKIGHDGILVKLKGKKIFFPWTEFEDIKIKYHCGRIPIYKIILIAQSGTFYIYNTIQTMDYIVSLCSNNKFLHIAQRTRDSIIEEFKF